MLGKSRGVRTPSVEWVDWTPRNVNIAAVLLPFLVVAAAVPLLWGHLVGPSDLVVFAAMYVLCGIDVTVGFHRMLTHRAFATHRATRYVFAVIGSMAIQGAVIEWVADHRKHHAHTRSAYSSRCSISVVREPPPGTPTSARKRGAAVRRRRSRGATEPAPGPGMTPRSACSAATRRRLAPRALRIGCRARAR